MNDWDAASYAAKDNLLRVLKQEADALFEMAANGPWTAKTACSEWEVRDVVGHLIDVTESYSGRNAKDYLVSIGVDGLSYAVDGLSYAVDGLSYAQEDVSGLPAVIEFDPGSLVLTAFGRVNAGTIRGDRAVADRFLNSFFRI